MLSEKQPDPTLPYRVSCVTQYLKNVVKISLREEFSKILTEDKVHNISSLSPRHILCLINT